MTRTLSVIALLSMLAISGAYGAWVQAQKSPLTQFLGDEIVDKYRMTPEDVHEAGGSVNSAMWNESDAMVLTRVSMGESPSLINDRYYIMWNIRLRAELGYKLAGYYAGYRSLFGRWGVPTSIKQEALCWQGCQYEPVRTANKYIYPFKAPGNIQPMLFPDDEQMVDFHVTYLMAQKILDTDFCEFPEELKGFDGFRSPSVSWIGRIDYGGGLPSVQLVQRGHIWRDETNNDNIFWREGLCEIDKIMSNMAEKNALISAVKK